MNIREFELWLQSKQRLVEQYITTCYQLARVQVLDKKYYRLAKRKSRLKKQLQFIPVMHNRNSTKPYLTNSEVKLLSHLKNGYYPENYQIETAEGLRYVFRCKSCSKIIISKSFIQGLDLIFDHYIKQHNDDLEHNNILISVRKLPSIVSRLQGFWLVVRLQASKIGKYTLAEYETKIEQKRNQLRNSLKLKETSINVTLINSVAHAFRETEVWRKHLETNRKVKQNTVSRLPPCAELNLRDYALSNFKYLLRLKKIKRKYRKQKPKKSITHKFPLRLYSYP